MKVRLNKAGNPVGYRKVRKGEIVRSTDLWYWQGEWQKRRTFQIMVELWEKLSAI